MVQNVEPHIGYVHRGIEKMCESLTYPQIIHLTDRMDYLSAHINNEAVCLAVEKALGIEVSDRVKYIRTILSELTRIQSHQLFWATYGMDLGGLTCFFYGLRNSLSTSARLCLSMTVFLQAMSSSRSALKVLA
jgi:NADH:ubiquinone oxidoreductase subunit D